MPKGEKRAGGRPQGKKAPHTLEAQEAKKRIIERVCKDVDALFDAQKMLAVGTQILMCKPERGKAYMVDDVETIRKFIDGELDKKTGKYYFMTTLKPDNSAIDSLFDRAFGKSTQPVKHEGEVGLVNLSEFTGSDASDGDEA